MEGITTKNQKVEFYNTTKHGSKIKGTEYMDIDELCELIKISDKPVNLNDNFEKSYDLEKFNIIIKSLKKVKLNVGLRFLRWTLYLKK